TRVREAALDAFTHQDLPFERLVEEIVVERDLAVSPLFQVMLNLQEGAGGQDRGAAGPVLTKFDLTLTLVNGPDGFAGTLEHSTDLFDSTTAARLLGRFVALLEGAIGSPGLSLRELPLLLPEELSQVLAAAHATAAPVPAGCLHELIAAQAARTPEAVAVSFRGQAAKTLTYRELDRSANRLAHRLIGLGVVPEARVGVLLERSPELVIALLAILKTGAAYVPLDPAHPAERRALILASAGAAIVLDETSSWSEIDQPDTAPDVRSHPDQLAYVLYTSGSTGAPKGVMVEHRSVVNYLSWCTGAYGLVPGSRSLVHSPIGFDLTVTALFGPLLTGGEVCLVPEAPGLDELVAALAEREVQLLKVTPAHLEILNRQLTPAAARHVKVLVVGGEALPGDALELWRSHSPSTLVVNEYGPTEATVGCSVLALPAAEIPAGRVPIGHPIANARLYVLDDTLRPLPPGVRGELFLGGGILARGYLGRADLTAESFVPDPCSGVAGARLYRTGDLVRRLPDGRFDFLGRLDGQVKIRGFRIEVGEIEATLSRHPQVAEAVVTVREDGAGPSRALAAYVVPGAARLTVEDLRSFLAGHLPAYMVPAFWVLLDALPLTANGKVDLRALPAPERPRGEAGSYLAPRDTLELRLAQIWEDLLDAGHPIGVRDDFFAFGGHSLLAVQLVARIEQSLGSSLPVAALLRSPTVEALAALLRDGVELSGGPLIELAAGPRDGRPLFLVHPVGGEVLSYLHLARGLAAERSVYGLQGNGESRTLEEMATAYLDALRAVQPAGPYHLGGWSLGGVVAFEMARQLEAAGETVALLALLDSYAPGGADPGDDPEDDAAVLDDTALVALFAHDLARLLGFTGLDLPPGFTQGTALEGLAAEATRLGLLPAGMAERDIARRFAVFAANHRAVAAYPGGPCAAPVLLLKAGEAPHTTAPDLGWSRLLHRPIEVQSLPGDHYALLQPPQVKTLSVALRAALADAEEAREALSEAAIPGEAHGDPPVSR